MAESRGVPRARVSARIVGGLAALGLAAAAAIAWADDAPAAQATGTWQATESMELARSGMFGFSASKMQGHTATSLDGPACRSDAAPTWCDKVLVVGGKGTREVVDRGFPNYPQFGPGGGAALTAAELYDPTTGTWERTGSLRHGRVGHTATLLDGRACRGETPPDWCGNVLVIGGDDGDGNAAELYDPTSGSWSDAAGLSAGREEHTATLLDGPSCRTDAAPDHCGDVIVTGGFAMNPDGGDNAPRQSIASAERYDPETDSWTPVADLNTTRGQHTATLLDGPQCHQEELPAPPYCGDLLVRGGYSIHNSPTLRGTGGEVYDPDTDLWTNTDPPYADRAQHTATLLDGAACRSDSLPDWCGKVMVAGGMGGFRTDFEEGFANIKGAIATVELYDPATRSWIQAGSMQKARMGHSATLLDGPSCEAEQPAEWCGKVMVGGGRERKLDGFFGNTADALRVAELFDPGDTGTNGFGAPAPGGWSFTRSSMTTPRSLHATADLPDGTVLFVGGEDTEGRPWRSAEVFDPAPTAPAPSVTDVTPSGGSQEGGTDVVITGAGFQEVGQVRFGKVSADSYTVDSNTRITATAPPHTPGDVPVTVVTTEGVSPKLEESTYTVIAAGGAWTSTAPMDREREGHTSTLLDDETVLVAAGASRRGRTLLEADDGAHRNFTTPLTDPLASAWRYHADDGADEGKAPGRWTRTGSLGQPRYDHTATRLPDGQVLVAGGEHRGDAGDEYPASHGYPIASAETYDPGATTTVDGEQVEGAWHDVASLEVARSGHTATRLPGGEVLVVGGEDQTGQSLTSVETYDPQATTTVDGKQVEGAWHDVASLGVARSGHTATRLPGGEVLVVGGEDETGQPVASAAVYDPTATTTVDGEQVEGAWHDVASLAAPRSDHSATLLADGTVLVAGGWNEGPEHARYRLASAERYDPKTGRWTSAGSMRTARSEHSATPLADGTVLVTGGAPSGLPHRGGHFVLDSAERYRPDGQEGSWHEAGRLDTARTKHATTLLPNGAVLASGGLGPAAVLPSAERYVLPPEITTLHPSRGPTEGGTSVTVTGARLGNTSEVLFGDTPARDFSVASSTQLTAVSPKRSEPGAVPVRVKGPGGVSLATAATQFEYVGDPDTSNDDAASEDSDQPPDPESDENADSAQGIAGPATIDDLSATALSAREVNLSFSAPSIDGPDGPAATAYVIKQSQSAIHGPADFSQARSLCDPVCQLTVSGVGGPVSVRITDLSPATTYYYAIRAQDDDGKLGTISNTAQVTTPHDGQDDPSSNPAAAPTFACPVGKLPDAGYTDVTADNVHKAAIDCITWYDISQGTSARTYSPAGLTTRAQMASFVARLMETAGVAFQDPDEQGFDDVAGNPHARRINQLAATGVVVGTTESTYAPQAPVTRAQMASLLVRAYEHTTATSLPEGTSDFTDTAGSVHQQNISKAAEAGWTFGVTPTRFEPNVMVRRDQQASFLARTLDTLVHEGFARHP